jgi:hypothetical protein
MLGLADPSQVYCIYIGDDRTDEDAFQGVCWYLLLLALVLLVVPHVMLQ